MIVVSVWDITLSSVKRTWNVDECDTEYSDREQTEETLSRDEEGEGADREKPWLIQSKGRTGRDGMWSSETAEIAVREQVRQYRPLRACSTEPVHEEESACPWLPMRQTDHRYKSRDEEQIWEKNI